MRRPTSELVKLIRESDGAAMRVSESVATELVAAGEARLASVPAKNKSKPKRKR